MTLPFTLPEWLPWWVPVALLVPALLYALVFVLMPFSVMGLKGRLDGIEARLDELHREVRTLTLRLPELGRDGGDFDTYEQAALRARPRPPIAPARAAPPPAAAARYDAEVPPPSPADPPRRRVAPRGVGGGVGPGPGDPGGQGRVEPRMDWPR